MRSVENLGDDSIDPSGPRCFFGGADADAVTGESTETLDLEGSWCAGRSMTGPFVSLFLRVRRSR